jgi:hypothetical protein
VSHPRAKLTVQGRRLLVERVLGGGWTVSMAAEAQGCSAATGYKWLRRYVAEGPEGLQDRSSRPHRSPARLGPDREAAILARREATLERWVHDYNYHRPHMALAGRPPTALSGKTLVKRRKTEQTHICLGTNGLARNDPERFAFGIVNAAIGGGMSSRLFQEIREKRGLAYSVYSYHSQYGEAGLFAAYAGTTPARAKEVLDLVREQLADVADGALSEEEFDRAKGHMKGSLVLSLEEPSSRMSRLGISEISHGEILTVNQILRSRT